MHRLEGKVFFYYQELPGKMNEMIADGPDGYTVYIDPRQSQDGIVRSFLHAMEHIYENDFEKEDVQEIEAEAHKREVDI